MCIIKPKNGELINRYKSVLDKIRTLDIHDKEIIKHRFFTIIVELEKSCNKIHYYFHLFRWLITTGSLIIPALLSIQQLDDNTSLIKNHTIIIYWATWFLSILVSLCNAYYTLYKIDKQYYLYHSMYEMIRSEGWQYFQLSGKYSGHFLSDNEEPTHKNQFLLFCSEIEKMKMRLVAEEYIKSQDDSEKNKKRNHKNSNNIVGPNLSIMNNKSFIDNRKYKRKNIKDKIYRNKERDIPHRRTSALFKQKDTLGTRRSIGLIPPLDTIPDNTSSDTSTSGDIEKGSEPKNENLN